MMNVSPLMAGQAAANVCLSLAEAFADDPFYQALTVDHAAAADVRRQVLADYFQLAINEARGIGEVCVANNDGASIWHTDAAFTAAAGAFGVVRVQALRKLLGPLGFKHYLDISEGMSAQVPATLESAWYLSILGVRAAARGNGVAHDLLVPTLQRADSAAATAYLETFNPLSLPFYARLGFIDLIEYFEPITQRRYWLLTRQPRV